MDDAADSLVLLGTEWVAAEDVILEFTGWLGLRSKEHRTPVTYLDWTIDSVPLRSILRLPGGREPDERTRMVKGTEGDSWATSSLLALLDGYDDDTTDEWVRYDSGRTAVFYCSQCADLGCPAITARIEFTDSTVRWSDVGYETEFSESPDFETFDRITLTFDRAHYEATIRALLTRWRRET